MSVLRQILVLAVLALGALGVWHFVVAPDQPPGDATRAAAATGPTAPPRAAPLPVIVAPAYTGMVETVLDAIGTTRANEAVEITAKTAGVIEELPLDDGAEVKAGDIIAVLDTAELVAERDSAQARLDNAQQALDRAVALARTNNVAQSQVDTLRGDVAAARGDLAAAQARLADREIRAPFSGTLGIRQVSPGALIAPGTAITSLDDLSIIRVDFSVPETMLGALRPGLSLAIHSDAFPDRDFTGRVTSIGTRVDPVTRAVAAVAQIANDDRTLRPGMFVTVHVTTAQNPDATLVPEEALVPEGEKQFVYVVEGDRAVRREITIGRRIPGAAEVLSGLEPGVPVVVEGVQRLRDGAPVAIEPAPAERPQAS